MKKALLIVACLSSWSFAGGPKFTYPSPPAPPGLDLEVQNIYHDLANPVINIGTASTMTITQLNASTTTLNGATYNWPLSQGAASTFLKNNGSGSVSWSIPSGTIKQIKICTTTTASNINSATYQATNVTCSITPSVATSSITVIAEADIRGATGTGSIWTIFRGSTDLSGGNTQGFINTDIISNSYLNLYLIDAPNTTSSTTYTLEAKTSGSAHSASTGANGETQVMILMEIGS